MLKVTSTGMETQDAHEDILVIGQVGHSLDILDVGMLHQKHSLYKFMKKLVKDNSVLDSINANYKCSLPRSGGKLMFSSISNNPIRKVRTPGLYPSKIN